MQDFDGLTAEEDWVVSLSTLRLPGQPKYVATPPCISRSCTQVPGGSEDSLSSNTELGRAVREACDEIEHLGRLVRHCCKSPLMLCLLPECLQM